MSAVGLVTLLCLGVLCGTGCKKKSEEVDGRTLEEWIAASCSSDANLRQKAYVALRSWPKDKSAQEAVLTAVRQSNYPSPERYTAALNLFRMTGKADDLIEPLQAAITSQFNATVKNQSTKELEDLIFWLEARAKPLIPTLKQARSSLQGQDPASVNARAGLTRVIKSIPEQ
jgi:hypothetical protein